MSKRFLWRLASLVMIVLGCTVMTSCFDDDDDKNTPTDPNGIKSVNVNYSITLSATWFDYYDVKLTYLDEAGEPVELYLNKDERTWSKSKYGAQAREGSEELLIHCRVLS